MVRHGSRVACVALIAATLIVVLAPVAAATGETERGSGPILNARGPAPSPDGSAIAFSYMGDIWRVSAEGGRAERLTVHDAYDDAPLWSPDGSTIAFTSDREGNEDVYVMPSAGGVPARLTSHSGWDGAQCWTRKSDGILFTSYRDTLETQLYVVPVGGGLPRRLIRDGAFNPAVSPDGRWIAYVRGGTEWWRKHYRGSASRDIWIRAFDGGPSTKIVAFSGDDDRPMWGADGRTLYFMSERDDRVMNIWKVDLDLPAAGSAGAPSAGAATQVTHHDSDGVQFASISADGSLIAYEWNAGVWKLRVPDGAPEEVPIQAPSDLKWNDDLRTTLSGGVTEFALSPDEDELAVVMRGEVYVFALDEGEAGRSQRVTATAARERDIAWMPDGETLLFSSDREGSYDVYAVRSTEEGEPKLSKAVKREARRLTDSPEDDLNPMPAPDGKTIAYMNGDNYLWLMGPDGKDKRQLLPEAEILHTDWSPDSRWIAVSRTTMGHKEDVFIVPADGGEAVNATLHPNDDFQPRWTDDGKRLSFASRTDDGQYMLKYIWLTREEYWKPASVREEEADEAAKSSDADTSKDDEGGETDAVEVAIDFDGLNERVVTVMNMRGGYDFYAQTPDGKHFAFRSETLGSDDLWIVDWEGNSLTQVSQGGCDPREIAWDEGGTTCYYVAHGGNIASVTIDAESGGIEERGSVNVSGLFTVGIPAERRQMFNEAWRMLLNGFYDPDFHGVDWASVRERYEPLALSAYTDREFRDVVREMLGELSASHLGIYKGGGGGASTGQLGLYHDERYDGPGIRVRRVIADGPADRAGIKPGEYIVSIEGVPLPPRADYADLLADTVDRDIVIEVAGSPGGKGARAVKIRPVGSWTQQQLVYEARLKENRSLVGELSGGTAGYVHIPGMGLGNLIQFEEDLFAQGKDKEGLVIDIRGNGGGSVHDEILQYLDRRVYGYETTRTRGPSYNPLELWTKPLVLLIDESCYSDAEIFPMGWKALKLGPVVGTPTFGAVIGTNDLELIDGTGFRVPGSGWYDASGRNLENWGIEPDVRIDSVPEGIPNGRDVQLEKAVEVLLGEIAAKR
jgi:tricorn protease